MMMNTSLRPFSMSTYDPFRLFDEKAHRMMYGSAPAFRTDILEENDRYVLQADLPGFRKEDIRIDLEEDTMTITAERRSEQSEENANYIRRERSYGSFTRRFGTEGIDTERMEASFTDGVLTLSMPKLPEQVPVSRRIEIR
ncbi:MAG: Hsp20/alpha crystallin family protein [Oscillospiraceae bacterium]|nr:Hsp20/alpha crystallin family protein [Oscillospiraceae bacterium]